MVHEHEAGRCGEDVERERARPHITARRTIHQAGIGTEQVHERDGGYGGVGYAMRAVACAKAAGRRRAPAELAATAGRWRRFGARGAHAPSTSELRKRDNVSLESAFPEVLEREHAVSLRLPFEKRQRHVHEDHSASAAAVMAMCSARAGPASHGHVSGRALASALRLIGRIGRFPHQHMFQRRYNGRTETPRHGAEHFVRGRGGGPTSASRHRGPLWWTVARSSACCRSMTRQAIGLTPRASLDLRPRRRRRSTGHSPNPM